MYVVHILHDIVYRAEIESKACVFFCSMKGKRRFICTSTQHDVSRWKHRERANPMDLQKIKEKMHFGKCSFKQNKNSWETRVNAWKWNLLLFDRRNRLVWVLSSAELVRNSILSLALAGCFRGRCARMRCLAMAAPRCYGMTRWSSAKRTDVAAEAMMHCDYSP